MAFAPGSQLVATGSWSNLIKLWSVPDCKQISTLKGHTERISGLAWHPLVGGGSLAPTTAHLVSAACDGTAKLWPLDAEPQAARCSQRCAALPRSEISDAAVSPARRLNCLPLRLTEDSCENGT